MLFRDQWTTSIYLITVLLTMMEFISDASGAASCKGIPEATTTIATDPPTTTPNVTTTLETTTTKPPGGRRRRGRRRFRRGQPTESTTPPPPTHQKCTNSDDMCKLDGSLIPRGCTSKTDPICAASLSPLEFNCVGSDGCCCPTDNCNDEPNRILFCAKRRKAGNPYPDVIICELDPLTSSGHIFTPSMLFLSFLPCFGILVR